MEQLILIAHLLIALAIIGLIMLQQGKGADMGASFGAGASQTLFGTDGSGNVLTRATAILATAFFATSFGLAVLARNKAVEVNEVDIPIPALEQVQREQPALPGELPAVDEDVPAALSAEGDIPEVE